jgi:hypothetical protein
MRLIKVQIGFFLAISSLATAQYVNVVSEGAGTTVIRVAPRLLEMDTVEVGGGSFLNLVFQNGITDYGSEDSYMRTYIPVLVGVFSKTINVEASQIDYSSYSGLPPLRREAFLKGPSTTFINQFIAFDQPFEIRGHIAVRIRVYPYTYDSTTGSYSILKNAIIRISSVGSEVELGGVKEDKILASLLVNFQQVKNAVLKAVPRLMKTAGYSLLSQGQWYEIPVTTSGIYKLTQSVLKSAGVPVDQIQMNTIRIFNNGGTELPQDPRAPRPQELIENSIYIYDANGNNKFDPEDYIVFYGRSPREWAYNPATKTYSHYLNHYTEANYYFFTFNGNPSKRMQVIPSIQSSAVIQPTTFQGKIFQEDETYNLLSSGKDWFGTELKPAIGSTDQSTAIFVNKLLGLDPDSNITYRFRVVARSDQYNYFQVSENATGTQLGTVSIPVVYYNDDQGNFANESPVTTFVGPGNLPDGRSALKFVFNSSSSTASGYIDWYEIFYRRQFSAVNDVLDFTSPDTTGIVKFTVSGFSSDSIDVFDVTDFSNVSVITPLSVQSGSVTFAVQVSSGAPHEFYAVGPNGYLSVSKVTPVNNSNLRGQTAGADLVIITPPDFTDQANQLANFKQSFDGLKTQVAVTTQIYNEFDCGIPDPTAIRDYLMYLYNNAATQPSYVLLLGDGTYDYKNKVASLPEYVPPYESDESLSQIGTFASDDYFVQVKTPLMFSPIQMSIGRLPARSVADAQAMVNKIIQYESKPDFGPWRNLVTFIGDDGPTSGGNDDRDLHTTQTEILAETYTPSELDKRKIYLALYPTTISTLGRRKPEAAADIINQINQGTLVVNFVGHGAPDIWSYTHIFETAVTVPQLVNKNRLTLFVAATCDFARYDDPLDNAAAEQLTAKPDGGGIGVISATRVVYSSQNSYFNNTLYTFLFNRDSQRNPERIGDAVFQTKQTTYSLNDVKYQLVGDPSVRIALPHYRASVDSLNGYALVTVQQIKALDKLDIKGTIYHPDNSVWSGLSGTGLMTVYDSDRKVLVPQWGIYYNFPGSILFRGSVSIVNGRFDAKTIVPMDISYSNSNGRIELYFQADNSDGYGYTRNVIVGGTSTTAVNNHVGPQIAIYFDSRNFRDGDVVSQNPTLIADIHASNGINLSDVAVGHSLQATFDNQQSVNLAPYYTSELNSYQDGTVTYPVTTNLSFGKHNVTVRALDVFNNVSTATATFDVESNEQLSLKDVFNYPNPFSTSTSFTFQRSSAGGAGTPIDVTIKIFTLSGRLIKTIHSYGITDNYVKIDWDGLDDDGNMLANGVYLYKVIARTVDGAYSSEALGKLAVIR